MASRGPFLADVAFNQNQLLEPRAQVLGAHPGSPVSAQFWYRSDLSNGTGSGVLYYRDSSGNNMALATGGAAISNGYGTITDGTTPANASGQDTFRLRTAGSGLSVATQNNDGTYGDNALFTLNSATAGANKVLLLDGSGGIAHASYVILGAGSTAAGQLGSTGTILTHGDGTTNVNVMDVKHNFTITGTHTYNAPILLQSAPAATEGSFGYSLVSHRLQWYDGTTTLSAASLTGTETLTNKTLTTPTIGDLSNMQHNHTSAATGGTLTHAAITDFDTQVRTSRLDQMASPTGAVSMNSQRITNLADPVGAQDAATKAYVDSAAAGIDWKASVRAASTANINLSAPGAAIDGVTMSAGDRFLAKNQTLPANNGIYIWNGAASAATRAGDADTSAEMTAGVATFVSEGTTNGNTGWVLTTDDPIILGTDALTFTQFTSLGMITPGDGLYAVGSTIHVGTASSTRIALNADSIDLGQPVIGGSAAGSGFSLVTVDVYGRVVNTGEIISANGLPVRTAAGTWTARQIDGTAGRITSTNPTGVGGNPTLDLASGIATPGSYDRVTVDTYGRVTGGTTTAGMGYAANVGDGASTSIAITHNLGTRDVIVTVFDNSSPYGEVYPEVRHTSTTQITLLFSVAPSASQYRVVIRAV